MDEADYLQERFDPSKLRVADLRRILLEHHVPFVSLDWKKVLVDLFTDNIAQKASTLHQKKQQQVEANADGIGFVSQAESTQPRARRSVRPASEAASVGADASATASRASTDTQLIPRLGKRKLTTSKPAFPSAPVSTGESGAAGKRSSATAPIDFSDDDDDAKGSTSRQVTPKMTAQALVSGSSGTPCTRAQARIRKTPLMRKISSLGLAVKTVALDTVLSSATTSCRTRAEPLVNEDGTSAPPGPSTWTTKELVQSALGPVDSPLQSPTFPPVHAGGQSSGLASARKPTATYQPRSDSPPLKKLRPSNTLTTTTSTTTKSNRRVRHTLAAPDESTNHQGEDGEVFSDDNPFQSGPDSQTPEHTRVTKKICKKTTKSRRHTTVMGPSAQADGDDHGQVEETGTPASQYAGRQFTFHCEPTLSSRSSAAPSPYAMRSPPMFQKAMMAIPIVYQQTPSARRASPAEATSAQSRSPQ
ncbi:hypothetical protein H4R33_006594, partial [Dimargaris cristalligena]